MVKAAEVIENVIKKKKRSNFSKNKKKAWRKHIDMKDVTTALEEKGQEERLEALGEQPCEDLFSIDVIEEEDAEEKENKKEGPETEDITIRNLEYVIDTNTGLKASNRPKSDKLIHEHRYLAGLPGAKVPAKREGRTREQHTLEWKEETKRRRLQNYKVGKKEEKKKIDKFLTSKKSRTIKKTGKKLSFDKDLWAQNTVDDFKKSVLDYTNEVMKKKFINNRTSSTKPNKVPAVIIPDAGLSYNPDLQSHRKLIEKATTFEIKRSTYAKKEARAKTVDFPKGACKVNAVELICDMNSEGGKKRDLEIQANCEPLVKRQKSAKTPKKTKEPAEEAPPVLKTEKKTHKEKLKMRRKKERLREEMKKNIFKKSQDEILRLDKINAEIDEIQSKLEKRKVSRAKKKTAAAFKAPKMFIEKDVEVALPKELQGRLLNVLPSSNFVTDRLVHVYRRGLLPSHGRNRKYAKPGKHNSLQKKVKARAVDPFTEEDFAIKKSQRTVMGK